MTCDDLGDTASLNLRKTEGSAFHPNADSTSNCFAVPFENDARGFKGQL
jgi:hypothetical protein